MGKRLFVSIFVIALTLISPFLFLNSTNLVFGFLGNQETFVLDFNNTIFNYTLTKFNDSNTTQEFDFMNSSDNHTFYISIPKNATVQNISMNLTGKLTTIYKSLVKSSGVAPLGISIGNVVQGEDENEIITGTSGYDGNVSILNGTNGLLIETHHLSEEPIYSTDIGNVTSDSGNEIAVGSADDNIYLLNSTRDVIWSNLTGSDVKSVKIGDLYDDGESEIIVGSDNIYLYNSTGRLIWNTSISNINQLAIGNLTSDSGNEIAVGCGSGNIYILNATGTVVDNFAVSNAVNTIDIGNVTSDVGNEIVVGTSDNKIYILNSTGGEIKNYTTGGSINSVKIGEVANDYVGKEIVAGDNDKRLYILNSTGNLVGDFIAQNNIRSIAIGDLTDDVGNEVVAGAIDGKIYTFNFDYFPTNLSIDVGSDSTKDWNCTEEKLRGSEIATGGNLVSAINNYLNDCSPDNDNNCQVPLIFNSVFKGKLNISNLNVTYSYNTSNIIYHNGSTIPNWSRTNNIEINEKVGYGVYAVNFDGTPAENITINYITVNQNATSCDFNLSTYEVTTTADGRKVCNISLNPIHLIGGEPINPKLQLFLWDNTMQNATPLSISNTTGYYSTSNPDKYNRRINLTFNATNGTFTNATAWWTVNDSEIDGEEFLYVYLSENRYSITPDSEQNNCNTSNPIYTQITAGSDIFYVCKKNVKGNMYFKWKQPSLSTPTKYVTGGSYNLKPELTNLDVTPSSGIWGINFTFSVNVSDIDGDMINVTLWIFEAGNSEWVINSSKNATNGTVVEFNITSDKNWTGTSRFLFEYFDCNQSNLSQNFHSLSNTTPINFNVFKHDISIIYNESLGCSGNNSTVFRNDSRILSVWVNDTNSSDSVEGANCSLWVGGILADYTLSNASGFCNFNFTPNQSFDLGPSTWKIGVFNDDHYNKGNSTELNITIKGNIHPEITNPVNFSFYKNESTTFYARLLNLYGISVEKSGYNCSFYLDNTSEYIGSDLTNSSGGCSLMYSPDCGLEVGQKIIIVRINKTGADDYYNISNNQTNKPAVLLDRLNLTILSPVVGNYYKGQNITLNSSVKDNCGENVSDVTVKWYLVNKYKLNVTIKDISGRNRTNYPIILNGSFFADSDFELIDWKLNNTLLKINDSIIPFSIYPWTSLGKSELNNSKVYMDNLTELVFLINLTANNSKILEINLKDSNPSTNDIKYNILNAGFDSGDFSSWSVSSSSGCTSKVSFVNKTYFANLSADGGSVELFQSLSNITKTDKVKISYKAWGEFYANDDYVGNFSLNIGGVVCNLTPKVDNYGSYTPSEEPWDVTTCEGSYSSAENISVILKEYEHEQNPVDMTYAQINYICFVDDNDACVNFHSGSPVQYNLTYRKQIRGNISDTYLLEGTENVGNRKIISEAEKQFYDSDKQILLFNLTGFANIKNLTINSSYCVHINTTNYQCMNNANLTLVCKVVDNYTTEGIYNYTVNFYNLTLIGSNLTDIGGTAVKYTQIGSAGPYQFSCNITDQPDIFYNVTEPDGKVVNIELSSGNTTAELNITLNTSTASNISIDNNFTTSLTFLLNNTGNHTMYNPMITEEIPSGILIPNISCNPIPSGEYCERTVNITVTVDALVGNNTINFTVDWQNEDATSDNRTANTTIDIEANRRIEFVENNLSLGVPYSATRTVNFTVKNYGNVDVENIILNLTGDNSSTFRNITTFINKSFNITKNGDKLVSMTVNATSLNSTWEGIYNLNITAEAENCANRSLPFILNITHLDWEVEPENISEIVSINKSGILSTKIKIDNLKGENITLNLSINMSGGTTINYLTFDNGEIAKQIVASDGETYVDIYYNTTYDISEGVNKTHNYTVFVETLDDGVAPPSDEISVQLKVINFTVNILTPTSDNQSTNVSNGTLINNIHIETKEGSDFVTNENNISFEVYIGGEVCIINNCSLYPDNVTPEYWNITCYAPEIEHNPIYNDLNVIINYTKIGDLFNVTEENAIIYNDYTSPWFSNITADFINNKTYLQDNITFEVNITDNKNISSVWAVVSHNSTGHSWTLNSSNYTEKSLPAENNFDKRNFSFTFSKPNYIGDYDIIVYANDTTGNPKSSKTGWFDIYLPVNVSGNLTDPSGTPIDANFTFYREGKNLNESYKIHEFSTKENKTYNWTLHKRKYDVKIDLFGQEVILYDANFNNSNNTNNPFRFDYFANYTSTPLYHAGLPNTAGTPILGVVVETNLTGVAEFTIDFEQALTAAITASKNIKNTDNFEILVCHDWDYATQQCNSSSDYLDRNFDPSGNIFEFNTTHLSAFIISEACYSGGSLIDCSGYYYTPPTPSSTSSSSSSSSSSSTSTDEDNSVCGNGVCETGENYQNCPQDCPLDDFPLIVDTNLVNARIFQGDSRTYQLSLKSKMSSNIEVGLEVTGTLKEILSLGSARKVVSPDTTEEIPLYLTIPLNQSTGIYTGNVVIKTGDQVKNVPILITVLEKATAVFSVELELATKEINPGDNLEFLVKLINLGDKKILPINLSYVIKEQKTGKVIKEINTTVVLENTKIIRESIPLNLTEKGFYNLEVWAIYYDRGIMDVETFELVRPLFESPWMVGLILMALLTGIIVGGTYIWRYYQVWKKEKEKEERYLYPLNYKKVPREGFKIGKFAGTDNYCYYNSKDLTTHLITAGATGAGKSVSASVFAEEALEKNIPVIVFDPTAQWTGFVKACKDTNLIKKYREFDMSDFDIKSYPGLIYDVEKPDFELKIKEFINPGEITIFCLNKLKLGEYDKAVDHIIKSIFGETWEETQELKLLIVFDEVHRLLEKYGGTGGYVALEKAAREFRKWGIGIIMCSQVLADFKSAISGNVLTEIQLNTKSLVDIEKVRTKYGEQYSQRITRMGVGAGLIQYPKYNDGKPFFVEFRPTKHNPHKITEAELSLYKSNIEKLKIIESKIKSLKERKIYTEDYELDLKLAMKKLKTGNFRMVEIYIASLEKSLEKV